ncbi:MAG TPA: hypothetical protein VJ373_00190 [Desulfatiglandales bacterium]|nr:hypothetical protein [Desulfatiglandales bacterium]
MNGWVTVDVKKAIEVIKRHAHLKILDDCDLVVESETEDDYRELERELLIEFKDQVNLERD